MAFSSRLGTVVLQRFTKSSLLNSYSFRQNSIKLQAVRLCSSTKNSKPITKEQKVHEALNKMNQVNQYGTIGGVFHISLSTLCLGFFYVLFSNGIDVTPYLKTIPYLGEKLDSSSTAGASTFVIAYAVNKVFGPVRMAITAASTPFIVKYLKTLGYFKKLK